MKKTAKSLLTALAALVLLAGQLPALAAESCAVCHRYPGLGTEGKNYFTGHEREPSKIHGSLYCSDCHKGYSGFPHKTGGEVRCDLPCHVPGANHEAVTIAVKAGPHGKSAGKGTNPCVTCHTGGTGPDGGTKIRTCEECHGKMETETAVFPGGPGSYGRRAHKKAGNAPTCTGCHGTHKTGRAEARAACANPGCHPGKPEEFSALYDHGGKEQSGGQKTLAWGLLAFLSLVLAANWLKGAK